MNDFEEKISNWIAQETTPDTCFILGVCGLGGSGKTTLARNIAQRFNPNSTHFEIDLLAKYPTDIRRARIKEALENGDPDKIDAEENTKNWYDWDGVKNALQNFRKRESFTLKNCWNQNTGQKDLDVHYEIPKTGKFLVIADCIYLLHSPVKNWFDKVIMIDVPLETTLARGRARDAHRTDPAYREYKESLTRKYCVPYFECYSRNADLVIKP